MCIRDSLLVGSSVLQQQGGHLKVALAFGQGESRMTGDVVGVDLGAVREQELGHLQVTADGRPVQGLSLIHI